MRLQTILLIVALIMLIAVACWAAQGSRRALLVHVETIEDARVCGVGGGMGGTLFSIDANGEQTDASIEAVCVYVEP